MNVSCYLLHVGDFLLRRTSVAIKQLYSYTPEKELNRTRSWGPNCAGQWSEMFNKKLKIFKMELDQRTLVKRFTYYAQLSFNSLIAMITLLSRPTAVTPVHNTQFGWSSFLRMNLAENATFSAYIFLWPMRLQRWMQCCILSPTNLEWSSLLSAAPAAVEPHFSLLRISLRYIHTNSLGYFQGYIVITGG